MNQTRHIDAFIGPATYQITVQGRIDDSFHSYLGDLSFSYNKSREKILTTLTGEVEDQSALSGFLNTLIDNRYTIISVLKLDQ